MKITSSDIDEITREVLKRLRKTMGKPGSVLPDVAKELKVRDEEIKAVKDNGNLAEVSISDHETRIVALESVKKP